MNYNPVKTILVAEDSADTRDLLEMFLTDIGYCVLLAENGREAEKLARAERPDLILMDLHMPVLDGIDASVTIRGHAELSQVPILAISGDGHTGIELFSDTEKLGKAYVGYIAKPIDLDALADEIRLVLSKASVHKSGSGEPESLAA